MRGVVDDTLLVGNAEQTKAVGVAFVKDDETLV
jgi:hypothetical protein